MKPGWKTSEFWLSMVVTVLGALAASGLLPAEHPAMQVVGIAVAALSAMGYATSRGLAKRGGQ